MTFLRTIVGGVLGTVLGKGGLDRIYDMETSLSTRSDPIYLESMKRLKGFKDKHKGKRCFIIGNGPSLKGMDLSPLKNEITFGLNRIYLLFKEMEFATTYYVSTNKYVLEQCASDIEKIPANKFIRWEFKDRLKFTSDTVFFRGRTRPGFYADIAREGLWEGATVTYVAMQLAFYMGFSEVILIGVDHNFKTKGEPDKVVVSHGDDPDHFDPTYFGKGFKWQLPDLETSERAYRMAKEAFETAGRSIVDATRGGKLTVFPKVRFEDMVGGVAADARR